MNILKWLHTRLTTVEICERTEQGYTCRGDKCGHYRISRW